MDLTKLTKNELLVKCEELGIKTKNDFSKILLISLIKQFDLEERYNLLTDSLDKNELNKTCFRFDNLQENLDVYNNLDLIYKPGKRMTFINSTNAYLAEIFYKKDEYTTNAILKSSKGNDSDNLLYEGIVGLFINKQAKKYPCFVVTYGLYFYNNENDYLEVNHGKYVDNTLLKNSLTKITNIDKPIFEKALENSKLFVIIMENLKNYKTLGYLLKNDNNFITNDLLYVLFQIYAPLIMLVLEFTHYDLHCQNVLLYELEENSYIEYHYQTTFGKVVSFKSKYIVKIIDYGYSYFNDKTDNSNISSSKKIYEQLLEIPNFHCNRENQGFEWFDEKHNKSNYFISSILRNVSHDIRLLNHIKLYYGQKIKKYNPTIHKILKYIKYSEGMTNENKEYGTKENTISGYPDINNIVDIWRHLYFNIMPETQQEKNNTIYKDFKKLGDLFINLRGDKPMEFIPI